MGIFGRNVKLGISYWPGGKVEVEEIRSCGAFCPARERVSVFQVDSGGISVIGAECACSGRGATNRQQPRPLCTARIKLSSA